MIKISLLLAGLSFGPASALECDCSKIVPFVKKVGETRARAIARKRGYTEEQIEEVKRICFGK